MPRTRNAITISVDDATLALIDTAATHHGNRSAAIKAFVVGVVGQPVDPQVSAPPAGPAGHSLVISEAGWAALARIAADAGRDPEEVARLALRYAVQYPARWLPPAETG